ncbi:hypothetical protein D3C80_551590 [compost metagenome]
MYLVNLNFLTFDVLVWNIGLTQYGFVDTQLSISEKVQMSIFLAELSLNYSYLIRVIK